MLIAISPSIVLGQSSQATSTPNPTLDGRARAISSTDLTNLFKGIYVAAAAQQMTYDKMPADKMPSDEPYLHYAGRGADGKYHLWFYIDPQHLSELARIINWWQNPSPSVYMIMYAADSWKRRGFLEISL